MTIRDQGSTNGVTINSEPVLFSTVGGDDKLMLGTAVKLSFVPGDEG